MPTEEDYQQMKKIVAENLCAGCGKDLTIRQNPEKNELEVWCPHNPEHHGFIERSSVTQEYRRGVVVHPSIQDNIERKMLVNRPGALGMIKARFPDAEMDDPSAALFVYDCMRLSLDPFLGEIVPVTFKSRRTNRNIVQPIITEDGYLSMAARGCPGDWIGPPKTMRLEEYLASQSEYKDRDYDQIKAIATDIKRDLCKDEKAYVWVAVGKRRDQDETVTYGWYKSTEDKFVSKDLPGNQARVRAIKRWAREVFPEAKANMQVMTAEWLDRAQGVTEITDVIEAEYSVVPAPSPEADERTDDEDIAGGPGEAAPQAPVSESRKGANTSKKSGVPPAPTSPRDPETIVNLGDLYTACKEDFNITRQEVWRQHGVSSQEDISAAPSEVYRQIAEVLSTQPKKE